MIIGHRVTLSPYLDTYQTVVVWHVVIVGTLRLGRGQGDGGSRGNEEGGDLGIRRDDKYAQSSILC